MRLTFCIFAAILIIANTGLSSDEKHFTGNPKIDLFGSENLVSISDSAFTQSIQNDIFGNKKSPFIAGGLSLLIPGAGQIYTKSYIKAGIFLAVEAAAWIYSSSYTKKGDDQTKLFQNFADERYSVKPIWDTNEPDRYRTRWDVIRYYEWSYSNRKNINPNFDDTKLPPSAIISNDESLPPWERVNWGNLNDLERLIGKWYSHTLPKHGDQQYYELIGKYQQFNQGWFDANNPNYTYGLPLSETLKKYSEMRGIANDYYYKAKSAMTVVVVNHVISAVDAYFTARSYNKNLKVEARLENQETPFGEIPVVYATIKVKF
ncbi:MAG: hypothetical protein Q8K98_03185 [Bacteroidota bacterium]|nr:hypothetical protein [Bacteroidota bacterium]